METGPTQPTDKKEKKGLSRIWKRFKAAFKDKEVTRTSTSQTTAQTAPTKPAQEITSKPKEEAAKPSEPEGHQIIAAEPTETSGAEQAAPMQTDVDRRLERAKAIFKKYDIEFDESEWRAQNTWPRRTTERVEKPIRMRVKYTCHNCSTTFGHEKICISCQHPRCTKCTRYPPKNKGKRKVAAAAATAAAPSDAKPPDKKCTCHECRTDFEIGAKECPNCHHKICDRCLKEALVVVSTEEPEKKPAPSEPMPAEATTAAS